MKRCYILMLGILISTFFSCNKDVEEIEDSSLKNLDKYLKTEIIEDVSVNGDYLEFKSKEVYDSIRKALDQMEYSDFVKWEKSLGFKSAYTWKKEFENSLETISSINEFSAIVKKYSDKLVFDENQIIRYKFYAESLDRILSIGGFVKIGKSLYKFTENDELISYDGSMVRIENALNGLKSVQNDDLLFKYSSKDNLKSTDDIVLEGLKTIDDRRLLYSLHRIVYSSIQGVDVYTGAIIYVWGYGLNLTMRQQKYSWFFGYDWRNMRASYYVRDVFIDWYEFGTNKPYYVGSLSNRDFSITSDEVKYWFVDINYREYYCGWGAWFICNQLDFSFYSSGIGADNQISIHLAQPF